MPANAFIADQLRRYAAALRLEGADRFKIKAYRRAADTIDGLSENLGALLKRGEKLTSLSGIGKAIASVIEELLHEGRFQGLDQKLAGLEPATAELAAYPMLDPQLVRRVYQKLGINRVGELKRRLKAGDIRKQFGARIDFTLRRAFDRRPRMLWWAAAKLVPGFEQFLKGIPGVRRVAATGSFRRKQETVGDLRFLVCGSSAAVILRHFIEFAGRDAVNNRSRHEASFRVSSGITVAVRWTSEKQWPLALMQATGSAAHLTELKKRAKQKRRSITSASLGKVADEADIYRRVRLKYVEPELREGRGEIEAAAADRLPQLVTTDDLQGDLHLHTTASDGANSMEEMVEAAQERGYRYIAVTDHSQSLKITNGLSERRLLEQCRKIERLNARLKNFVILKAAEVDILENGWLDYSNAVLKQLDLAICSIHSRFSLDGKHQTDRILRAMDNRYFTILGHATGRLLLTREGYDLDVDRILQHAKAVGCFVEINSSPNRLDLSDEHARRAKDLGVKVAVNTDAHSIRELDFIAAGMNQARRAWLEPADVLNTLSLAKLRPLLRR